MSRLMLTALIVGSFTTFAVAGPISLDGTIDGDDTYQDSLTDSGGNEAAIEDSLDIDTFYFDLSGGFLNLGYTVHGAALDTDGGSITTFGWTIIYNTFTSTSGTQQLGVVLDAGSVMGVTLDGAQLTDGVDYNWDIDDALEIQIDDSLLSATEYTYSGQIDNTGFPEDDVIDGNVVVPEPLTLSLLALGAPALLRRRKR